MKNLRKYHEGIRSEMLEFIPKQYARVLEIGCGKGGFKKNLLLNCEYWGIEPYEEVATLAFKKLDYVLVSTFNDAYDDLPNDYFDLVICNDVIEHMYDHHEFYEKIQKKCVKNAYMIGSIPNVRYIMNLFNLLVQKDWKYKEEGILDRTHLRFFTLKSIKEDFKLFDFKVEKLYGINEIKFTKRSFSGLKMILFQKILGEDTKYLQFAFRIQL